MTKHCDRCGKPIKDPQIQIQLIRYGYKGPEMDLCNSCYRGYQNWFRPMAPGMIPPAPSYIQ